MLLATAICLGFVIKMCTAATSSPDHFDDVFVCVETDRMQNVTTVTWTIAAYIQAKCCDLVYFENETSESSIEQNLSPTGTFYLPKLKESVLYAVQVTCFVSSCNGPDRSSETSKSSEVAFVSGSKVSKVCSKTHPPQLSNGQILVCIQETQGKFIRVVQWWSSQPFGPTSCILNYTSFDAMGSQHRTETFRDLPMNNSMFLPVGGASDVWMECNDSNNEKQSSGMIRYNEDSMQRVCSSVGVDTTPPNTAKNLPTVPTQYSGVHVSSLVQGLVLAFSMIVVALAMSLLAYKRYKSFMRRRSQRLLRIETEEETNEEEAAMHEFQRMV